MYRLKPGIKQDPERRWALPDRMFFGHGACHILAGVYLSDPPLLGFYAERIVPSDEFSGNHIYVTNGIVAFDYHGYSLRAALLKHHSKSYTRQCGKNWSYSVEQVDFDLLNTAELNFRRKLGPDQYLKNPIPRAHIFIKNIEHEISVSKAMQTSV